MKASLLLFIWLLLQCAEGQSPANHSTSFGAKTLHGRKTSVYLLEIQDEENLLILDLGISPGESKAEIKYSEVHIVAFDQRGNKIRVTPVIPELNSFALTKDGKRHGSYYVSAKSGQKVVAVDIQWQGDKQTFSKPGNTERAK